MADAEQTNSGLTTTSSEASLPVDGKGWVSRLNENYIDMMSNLQLLEGRTTSSSAMQNAMDALDVVKKSVLAHVRTATFNRNSDDPTEGLPAASADPAPKSNVEETTSDQSEGDTPS